MIIIPGGDFGREEQAMKGLGAEDSGPERQEKERDKTCTGRKRYAQATMKVQREGGGFTRRGGISQW